MKAKNFSVRITALFIISALTAAVEVYAQTSGLMVGAARRDVTPREPVPMWGYGARHDALSQGTLDPLHADAIVIQAGGTKLAIVGLDLGRSPAEASLQRIRERIKPAGIEYSFIAGSHTHHGPVLELTDEPGRGKGRFDAALRYYRQMEDAIVEAILEADRELVPARLASGSVQLQGFNRNRHTKLEPKASDRDLTVMRFDSGDGKPIAVLVNFAAHPTMISSSTLKFSADYVGALKTTIEKATGAPAVFINGAAGDQSVNFAGRGKEGNDYELFGRALGEEAVKLVQSLAPEAVAQPSLQVRETRFKYAPRTDLSNPVVRGLYEKAFFPELIPNYIDEYADGVRPRLTVALLNREIALVGASGEFFSNHSIRLKERARVKQVFFLGYCNGYHQYFPTIEGVAEGGYGADNQVSPAAVGAGEEMMNTALVWIYNMLGKIK
ncbi:MAG: neutral/alkaline non-lysosomal ceramidase N-terminal domain-containing protein [Acidobacteriota bacterium]|nr:MAG: neutral/alkaline non-lysosomal ceramidase N-terminal domain-containing protein [Acidobacteriota bacterium]